MIIMGGIAKLKEAKYDPRAQIRLKHTVIIGWSSVADGRLEAQRLLNRRCV